MPRAGPAIPPPLSPAPTASVTSWVGSRSTTALRKWSRLRWPGNATRHPPPPQGRVRHPDMSHLEFTLGARTGFRGLADEDELAGQRVRQVLRITQDLRELFSGSSSILDIASGSGEAVLWYRSLFPGVRLVCLERPDPTLPRPPWANFAGMAHSRRFDGVSIPYADASFDVITGCGGLAGTPVEQRPAALAEAYRVLKPGGLIILFEPTGAGLSGRTAARMVRTAGFLETTVRCHGPVPLLPLGPEFHVVAYRS